jgi:iron complex outermembrane recepter protein
MKPTQKSRASSLRRRLACRVTTVLAVTLSLSPVHAQTSTTLEPVVITAPAATMPLKVTVDPKAPQQPLPANDGASFLKNIPGFSLIRKGGTDGDPVFRGLSGSRLNFLLDGMEFHGGCSSRMDPPTAYIFPESYDEVTLIKGPQTVRYGNGNAAGVVLFDHDRTSGADRSSGLVSLLAGSWGRLDGVANAYKSSERTDLRVTLTHAESNDYEDGAGVKVNSAYKRQSATFLAGLRLDANTRVDIDGVISEGEAAYADRSMDGSKFDRESVGLGFEKSNLSPFVQKISARVYRSYIDHVMDNYSLRTLVGSASAMNPDRETLGARFALDLAFGKDDRLALGADWRDEQHTSRNTMAMMPNMLTPAQANLYVNLPRKTDYESQILGLFAEWTHALSETRSLVTGARVDRWSADRWFVNMMNMQTYQGDASETLTSGFVRLEQKLSNNATTYLGYGLSQRPMDYWEASRYEGINSGFENLKPETTHQVDGGLLWKADRMKGSLSAFYAKVDDYVLVYSESGLASCAGTPLSNSRFHTMGGTCVASGNVDATRYGFELEGRYSFSSALQAYGSIAYVRAENDTMNVPLAQTPPVELKLGFDRTLKEWTVGGVMRAVSKQSRVHPNYGSIVGVDRSSSTPSFTTLGINASYRPTKESQLSFGVDNLLDKNYYEHMSKTDASVSGYSIQTGTAVNEPGRTFWLKGQLAF